MTPDREVRTVATGDLEIRATGKRRKIVGHAALFGVEADIGPFRETIAPGTFAEAVKRDDVRGLYNHDANLVLGRTTSGSLKLREDSKGLLMEITPPDTQWANDLLISIDRGDVDQASFAFSIAAGGESWSEENSAKPLRTISNVKLFDTSVVTFAAYTETSVSVRALATAKKIARRPRRELSMRQRREIVDRLTPKPTKKRGGPPFDHPSLILTYPPPGRWPWFEVRRGGMWSGQPITRPATPCAPFSWERHYAAWT